LTLSSLGPRII